MRSWKHTLVALPAALAALLLMLPAPQADPGPSAGRPSSPAERPASEQAIAPQPGAVAAREPGRPA